jgi:hypothetical protein
MDYTKSNMYFAAKSGKEVSAALMRKAERWSMDIAQNGYFFKLRQSWMNYEGVYSSSYSGGSHQISFTGEQGELVEIAVNHYRNIADHMIAMITASRPAFEARAANTDAQSIVQTKLANALLEYYMREKKLEGYLETAVKYATVLGSGYIKMTWNAMAGEVGDVDENGVMVHEGDVEFENLSPFDVFFDGARGGSTHDWVVCRSFKNRFDIIAKYPELEDKILSLPTKESIYNFRFGGTLHSDSDDIPIYEFFHKRTESIPEGRYLLYLSDDLPLLDTPLPYQDIPVYRIAPANVLGTPYGTSPMFNLLPIQDAVNSLYSTILTNQHAFGVQNIYVPRGADVQIRALEGGLNIVEGNSGAGKPEALNLTATPREVFDFLQKLENAMETVSGINSVVRGNPEASLKSGTALATVQSTALQFINPLQMSYIRMLEDVGTGLINMLKTFAHVPRVAAISGTANKSFVNKEFNAEDLSMVNRVFISVANPLSKTTAGKTQIASELLQYQLLKTPEQYFTVLNTGNLEVATEDTQDELINIKKENERLISGKQVKAFALDQHLLHIKGHRSVISDPAMREPENDHLAANVTAHIQEHLEMLKTVDPALLAIIGEQSLQAQNPPQSPIPPEQVNNSKQPEMGPLGAPNMQDQQVAGQAQPAQPPANFVTAEQQMQANMGR